MCHLFRRRGHPPDVTDDLAQETFLRAVRAIGQYRGTGSFESWLLRIADNVHRETHRHALRAKRHALEVPLDGSTLAARDLSVSKHIHDPLRRLLAEETLHHLAAALDELSPQMRRCLLLRGVHDLTYREIARRLDTSIDVVKVQLHRGRQRLRRRLNDGTTPRR